MRGRFKLGITYHPWTEDMRTQRPRRHRGGDSFRALFAAALTLGAMVAPAHSGPDKPLISADCQWHGIKLFGKVQIVQSFPDIKIQQVESFPDLNVLEVTSFPDACGRWQFVDSFPDFKIQYVDSFPDLKIEFVKSFPGLP